MLTITAYVTGDDPPQLTLTAPPTGPGASAPPCTVVRGTATLAEGMALFVAVRRKPGLSRPKTIRFYRVDATRASTTWDVPISLDAANPEMSGEWYSIWALSVSAEWADFLEKVDGTTDGPLVIASAMPPHEGEAPSINVQRGAGQGSC
ncbi:hypothetical protein ACFPZ3_16145 [Nonomuraea insulae]|uniref:Uncharacterized protein n=1 Tax=Nonomuraea insulae TaxID=1616787 RepID=A0ABW1CI79_9ACTN